MKPWIFQTKAYLISNSKLPAVVSCLSSSPSSSTRNKNKPKPNPCCAQTRETKNYSYMSAYGWPPTPLPSDHLVVAAIRVRVWILLLAIIQVLLLLITTAAWATSIIRGATAWWPILFILRIRCQFATVAVSHLDPILVGIRTFAAPEMGVFASVTLRPARAVISAALLVHSWVPCFRCLEYVISELVCDFALSGVSYAASGFFW